MCVQRRISHDTHAGEIGRTKSEEDSTIHKDLNVNALSYGLDIRYIRGTNHRIGNES